MSKLLSRDSRGKNTAESSLHNAAYSVDEAIEQLIDNIDPKLRLVPGYRKKLRPVVRTSLQYINQLVDQIPGPVSVSRKTFTNDPAVRAYFATPDVLQETFSCGTELTTYFEKLEHRDETHCCALLCAHMDEKNIMGMALEGDIIRRDIVQTSINFSDYKILSPASDDEGVRQGIKKCIFDGLTTYALHQIASIKAESRELTNLRRILHAQLRARQSQGSELNQLLAQAHLHKSTDDSTDSLIETATLEKQFADAEKRLKKLTGERDVFSFYLQEIIKIFDQPENFVQLNVLTFGLTDMKIKVEEGSQQTAHQVSFTELTITNVMKRIVTTICYNKDEINCNKSLF